ncbi:MAG TPA: class II aldolase/adducin family protein, partial [Acidimicrobiales bacterium]|nr:class II aldolase/adducin family protein [Acidimicrobiales bacterium]
RYFLLTTTGAIRGLQVDQLGVIDMDGTLVEGELAPDRAEIVAMHSVLYRTRPDVGSVFHTHSPSATAFALANQALPARMEALLRFGQTHSIPVVPWGPRGSQTSVRGIEAVLADQTRTIAVLLANHGLLAFGPDPATTADIIIAIEETAQAELAAAALGGGTDLPVGAFDAVHASIAKALAKTGSSLQD